MHIWLPNRHQWALPTAASLTSPIDTETGIVEHRNTRDQVPNILCLDTWRLPIVAVDWSVSVALSSCGVHLSTTRGRLEQHWWVYSCTRRCQLHSIEFPSALTLHSCQIQTFEHQHSCLRNLRARWHPSAQWTPQPCRSGPSAMSRGFLQRAPALRGWAQVPTSDRSDWLPLLLVVDLLGDLSSELKTRYAMRCDYLYHHDLVLKHIV